MKKLLFFTLASLICTTSFSQTVENIRVEPEGENIKIIYRIGGSIEGHVYNVVLTCSIDGGPRLEPKTVIGDVGKNIRGGRSYYTIVWDVFEDDVEEIGDAEFFIKVELVGGKKKDKSSGMLSNLKPVTTDAADYRKVFITYELTSFNPLGFRAGTLGNWGYYGSIRIGYYDDFLDSYSGSVTAGATKRILNMPKYRLHGYAGLGIGDYFDEFDVEFGVSNVFNNRWVINFGFEYPTYYLDAVFGIGIVF